MIKVFPGVVLLMALSAGAVLPARGEPPGQVGDQDRRFIFEASGAGLAEVNLSRIALKSSMSKDVRDFAQRMIDDHTKGNAELLDLVNKKGMATLVAPTMPAPHRMLAERLTSARGEELDRAYARQMVKDHEDAVKLFEKEASSGQDADLKALAKKMLPTLQKHLEMARKMEPAKDKK